MKITDRGFSFEKEELKPCPFCGKVPVITSVSSIGGRDKDALGYVRLRTVYEISDEDCGIFLEEESEIEVHEGCPKVINNGYERLVRRWNTRA